MTLQRRPTDQNKVSEVPLIVHEVLRSPGRPLDHETRSFMEHRFGHDFSQVRVHTDAKAAESAHTVNALAYTVKQDVIFGSGQYSPKSKEGQRLLAHELTHVVQQAHPSSVQTKMLIDSPDSAWEQQADNAAKNLFNESVSLAKIPSIQSSSSVSLLHRQMIHRGRILDEGNCEHLACNSKFSCEDEDGIACPDKTRNAFSKTNKKFRPLFTCDTKCENNETCDDTDTWMAIPKSRFTRKKCSQDLVICANGNFVHAHVRDRSDKEAFEVSRGIQDQLGVPTGTFQGTIYSDENDSNFTKDKRCGN